MTPRPLSYITLMLAVLGLISAPSGARANLLLNGDFSAHTAGFGQLSYNGYTVDNWTPGGTEGPNGNASLKPVFLFSGDADGTGGLSTGVTGSPFFGQVRFFGGNALDSPNGGNVIAIDGDSTFSGTLSQSVSGLTPGNMYTLTFNWAGAQQQGFSGDTTERWDVQFGNDTQSTPTVNTPSQTFVGWQPQVTMTFTASSATQTLTFMAKGTPVGQPPWLLLNGVSLTPVDGGGSAVVPEPSSLAIASIGIGLGLVGLVRTRYRKSKQAPNADA